MKNIILFLLIFSSFKIFSQNILNAKTPEELRKMRKERYDVVNGSDTISTKHTLLPYGYVEDKDISWQLTVWEIIDLNDKINQPYYYSQNDITSTHTSLYDALYEGLISGKIKEIFDDDNFENKIAPENVSKRLESVRESDWLLEKRANGDTITEEDRIAGTDNFKVDTKSVKLIKIKGLWYIDKRLGEMKYRILGIAPMGPDPQVLGLSGANELGFQSNDEYIDLFWIFYPDAREVLSSYTVFNPKNGSSPITFDDLLNVRRFSSIIYKSDSGNGDGEVSHYIPKDAKAQLEESNRLKGLILQKENNMWNY